MQKIKMKVFLMITLVCLLITGFSQIAYADIGGGGLVVGIAIYYLIPIGILICVICLTVYFILKWIKNKNDDIK